MSFGITDYTRPQKGPMAKVGDFLYPTSSKAECDVFSIRCSEEFVAAEYWHCLRWSVAYAYRTRENYTANFSIWLPVYPKGMLYVLEEKAA